jgi:predicted nucleic acid-binding protein
MNSVVLLDTGPLGLITNPRASQEADACNHWLQALVLQGMQVKIPEIADYELRRELLRADKFNGIKRLDDLRRYLDYIPITTQTMLKAAQFWAQVRKQGMPTADNKALDGDVILAAQAAIIREEGYEVVIATTNVGHLSRLSSAKEWRNILL